MTKEHIRTQSESQEIDFDAVYTADKYIYNTKRSLACHYFIHI